MGDWVVTDTQGVLHVKHRLVLPAALVAAVLSLAACAPNQEGVGASTSPTASASEQPNAVDAVEPGPALEAMEWIDNGDGVAPDLEADTPFNFTETGALVVSDGDGETISEGQMLSLDYVIKSGTDISTVYSTYDNGAPEQVQFISSQIDPVIGDVLADARVGIDFLYAVPDQGQGATVMMVTVSDVSDVLERAEGTAVAPVEGLPEVTLAENGAPSVTYPSTTPPEELVAQDLITGIGPEVEEGQTVTVHYTGWVWNGDQFDSSWDRGAPSTFTLATGSLIDGWVQGLTGKTVGSQVLLVVPPELGYGESGSGEAIPGGATLVFVVDILAAS